MSDYFPFDQASKLPTPPWHMADDLPALKAWEAAHGHDVRLKCYPEYGCQAVQACLDRVTELIAHARRISAGPGMAVYVADLEKALGLVLDVELPHKIGQNDG